MADEAVLRIVLDDKSQGGGTPPTGGGSGPNSGAGTGGSSGGGSFDPVAEAQKRFEADRRRAAIDAEYAKLRPVDPPFDPTEVAKKRLEADQRRAAIEAEYAKLVPPTTVEKPFDPTEAAKKRLEADQRRAAIDAEYAKLLPPPTNPPFDPVVEAKKRLEKDKQRAEIDAEYAKLKPIPPFDPSEEARKRRESEQRRAQIDEAYKEQYGDDEKETSVDQFLKIADSLRGTLGGVFGTVVGAALDLVSGVRKAQVEANKEKHQQDLLAEAEETTKAAKPVTKPAPPSEETKAAIEPPAGKDTQLAPKGKTTQLTPQNKTTQLGPQSATAPDIPATIEPTDTPQPSASDIANKFKVPKAGTGTATGAKNTTQAADIEKVGTDVGGGAGATEGAAAEAGGGAMAGLAEAVPLVGILMAVNEAVKGAIKGVIGGIGGIAREAASANPDPSVPIEKLGAAVSDASDKLGILGGAALIGGESLKALAGVMQALDATAQRYGEYSAPIAQAQAIAEVRHTMGDLRRANEISPEMVRYIQAQTDIQEKFEDIKIRLLTKIMPMVTRMLEILELIMTGGENIIKGIELLATPLTKMLKILAEWFGWTQDKDRNEVQDPTTILFDPRFDTGGLGTPQRPGFVPEL